MSRHAAPAFVEPVRDTEFLDELPDVQVDDVARISLADPELRAAVDDAFRIRPEVWVEIDGQPVAAGPRSDGSWPTVMVVDGLSIRWGRSDVLGQPEPATGKLEIFDTSRTWAVGFDPIGRVVTIRYKYADPRFPDDGVVFFRGRIMGAEIEPKTVQKADATLVDGALVRLRLASLLTDLANRKPTERTWPVETIEARRARVAALTAGPTTSVGIRSGWSAGSCYTLDVGSSSALDLLKSLYDTAGFDRYTYSPQTQAVQQVPRRNLAGARATAQLWWEIAQHPRAGKGVFARAIAYMPNYATTFSKPLYVDAGAVEYAPSDGLTKDAASRISRVSVDWQYSTTQNGANFERRTSTSLVPGVRESVTGERAATLTSWTEWQGFVDPLLTDLVDFVSKEGAQWKPGSMRWDTRRTGGFESLDQVESLLAGQERIDIFFLQGSWLPRYGVRPLFSVMGGSITYRAGGWIVEWETLPIATSTKQHALTWEEFDDGSATYEVRWYDGDNPRGMHESLTYEDLGHIGLGLAVAASAIGPDKGYDQ